MKLKAYYIKFNKISLQQKLLLMEGSIYTIWAYVMIRIFSFKTYLKWLKNPQQNAPSQPVSEQSVKLVYHTIKRIEQHAFWTTTCYTKAIAARLILKRKNIQSEIYLGMCKDENGELLAHAWTKVDGKVITGGGNLDKYKVLYIFD